MFRPLFHRIKNHNSLLGKNILVKHYSYSNNSNWPNNDDDHYKKTMWFLFAVYLFVREPTQRPPPSPYA